MPWLKEHDPFTRYAANTIMFNGEYCHTHCNTPSRPTKLRALSDIPRRAAPRHLPPEPLGLAERDIALISLGACTACARRNYHLFTLTIKDIDAALGPNSMPTPDLKDLLLPEFRDFADVFSPKEAEQLPPQRPYDHDIKLLAGKLPPFGPLYLMLRDKLKGLKEWLEGNLRKGFIRPGSSPAASPVLFVSKPGGGLRILR